ncbi:alpha/beta hydrolase family protein [Streptomyces sp. NPDC004976]
MTGRTRSARPGLPHPHPGDDPVRIALLGVSVGGYLAPRAAAYERRLAAVIALDGVFDAVSAHLPLPHDEVVRRAAAEDDGELDQIIADARAQGPTLRWASDHGRYVTGTSTDRSFLTETPAITSTTEARRRSPALSWFAKPPQTCSTPPPKSPIRAICTSTSQHGPGQAGFQTSTSMHVRPCPDEVCGRVREGYQGHSNVMT